MEMSIEQLLEWLAEIAPNPYLQALVLIVVFYLLARLLDAVITRVLKKWIKRTSFTLDDQILEIFRRPVFVSVMLFGMFLAAQQIELPDTVRFLTLSALKTVAIFIWAA